MAGNPQHDANQLEAAGDENLIKGIHSHLARWSFSR